MLKQIEEPSTELQFVIEYLKAWVMTENRFLSGKSQLFQNYPNPFNPETWIPFELSNASEVTVKIYSSTGSLVRKLNLGHKEAGYYVAKGKSAYWDGKNQNGELVSSGIYFYSIKTGDYTATKKMVIQK